MNGMVFESNLIAILETSSNSQRSNSATDWANAIPVCLHCKAERTFTADNLLSHHIQLPGWDMSTAKIYTPSLYLKID
ncbi:hypothetical protein SAMN04487946_1078 [Halobellus clavatus]|uniref:Uncharacterized protein n=1 Tax=Halobellus clavatus TaxID=660517 RepID=A0A1H3HFL8_9EURY|nr:hypothetical protein SAMN04487946_1078 [Halobellus clavatus]